MNRNRNTRRYHPPSQRFDDATCKRVSDILNKPTKRDIYADLAAAVANTAALPVERDEEVEASR